MKIRTILDGNAFYEIDEECMERREQKRSDHETGTETGKGEQNKYEYQKNRN